MKQCGGMAARRDLREGWLDLVGGLGGEIVVVAVDSVEVMVKSGLALLQSRSLGFVSFLRYL